VPGDRGTGSGPGGIWPFIGHWQLFATLKKNRVISLIHPENLASIRAAERLGESLQGRTDMMGHDRLVYGIDGESYAAQLKPRGDLALPVNAQGWKSPSQAENPRL
jgi:hypothetical protein